MGLSLCAAGRETRIGSGAGGTIPTGPSKHARPSSSLARIRVSTWLRCSTTELWHTRTKAIMTLQSKTYDQAIRLNASLDNAFYDRAIADYDQALRINPSYASALYNRRLAYERKGGSPPRDGRLWTFPPAEIWHFRHRDPSLHPGHCGCDCFGIQFQVISKGSCDGPKIVNRDFPR